MRLPGKIIPVSIHPLFWVLAALIGWLNSGSLPGTLIWVVIILISVLVHEFGHALTALAFGKSPRIELVAMGGVTTYQTDHLKFWKQFLIVLNGPFFGFLLFVLASIVLQLGFIQSHLWLGIITTFQMVNLFWSIVNLVPVLPLDGGQLLRIVLEATLGLKGVKLSFFIGMCIAVAISFVFFIMQAFLLGALFFLFAFQSFDTWRKSRFLSDPDRDEDNRKKMQEAEMALQSGRKDEAKKLFQEVCSHAPKGILHNSATQYLAFVLFDEGKRHEAYELLVSVKEHLADEAACLLHDLAYEEKNYPLVADLSSTCYQFAPSQEIALRNSRAFAFLKKPKPAGGWLQTAWNMGNLNVEIILSESIFDTIRQNPEFTEFTSKLIHKQ